MSDQGHNALIYGFNIEHNPAAEDGRTVTVHTDVGDQRITREVYERILLRAKDTESFRMALFEEVLKEHDAVRNQGGPVTAIGAENPSPGTVDQRSAWERPSQPPATERNLSAEARGGTIQQPAVTPGGLLSTPERGGETLPVTPGEAADSGGPLVNDQKE